MAEITESDTTPTAPRRLTAATLTYDGQRHYFASVDGGEHFLEVSRPPCPCDYDDIHARFNPQGFTPMRIHINFLRRVYQDVAVEQVLP